MLHRSIRLLIPILSLILFMNHGVAQTLVTTGTENGALIDYPENWQIETFEDDPDFIAFTSGSMTLRLTIQAVFNNDDNLTQLLEDWTDEVEAEADDIGDFSEMQTYFLNGLWDVRRVQRIRSDDRLIETLMTGRVNGFIVFLRGSFRVGAQDFFLPIYDEMLSSLRHVDDDIILTHGSSAQQPLIDGMIGSVLDPLDIGALNTNFITLDEQYQFDYPDSWDIRTEADSSITIIERTPDAMLFGQLIISPAGENPDIEGPISARLDNSVEVSEFMLNDLPASRALVIDEINNIRHIIMATIRDDTQVLLDVTLAFDTPETTDAILRAMLYSVRRNGEPFTLSASGAAMRTGLLSAEVYGSSRVQIDEIVVDGIALDSIYITRNGRFTFNYPSEWFEAFIEGNIVLSNDDDIDLYEPSRSDVQLIFNFIETPGVILDDYSPASVLEYIIENDEFNEDWSDIVVFESLQRDAAYADYVTFGDDIDRVYFVKLDDIDTVYARVDMIIDSDNLEEFEPVALAILDTIRFQN